MTGVWMLYEHNAKRVGKIHSATAKQRVYGLIQTVVFFPQILGVRIYPFSFFDNHPEFNIFGLLIFYLGIAFAVWARIEMRNTWGIPGSWDDVRERKLITKGPFGISRNPIYVGLILACFGFEMAVKSYLILLVLPLAIYFYWEIRKEEKILLKKFGKEYSEYKIRVGRFI